MTHRGMRSPSLSVGSLSVQPVGRNMRPLAHIFVLIALLLPLSVVATTPFSTSSSSASSGSGSGTFDAEVPSAGSTVAVLQNASTVVRLPIDVGDAVLFNSSGSTWNGSIVVEDDGNETITFASLLVPDEKTVIFHVETLNGSSSDGSKPSISTEEEVVVGVSDAERIPIEEDESSNSQLGEIVINDHEKPRSHDNNTDDEVLPMVTLARLSFPETAAPSQTEAKAQSSPTNDIAQPASPVVEAHGVPSPPTLVVGAASDGRAEVSWQVPDDDGSDPIDEYEVAWIDEAEGKVAGTKLVMASTGSLTIGVESTSSSTGSLKHASPVPTTVIVSPLVNGRSYTFKVRAKNKNGYSTWSAKSLAVSPLHPPDLCGRVTCSGHGTCFPNYGAGLVLSDKRRLLEQTSSDGQCICRPGFSPPDCSVKNDNAKHVWKVTEWSQCSSGCGGGKRTREATCWDTLLDAKASSETLCSDKKPSLTRICNGMECGSKVVSVRYDVETSFDEVLFSPKSWDAFELSFTTEIAAALQIPRSRLEITAIKRGSIVVFFQILPAARVGEQSLNDIVERLQIELGNATSTLRSQGTFARRVETNGVKLTFSIADQSAAGGAGDISVVGLIGTVLVLCFFVAAFGWFLRKRHERLATRQSRLQLEKGIAGNSDMEQSPRSEMKRMGIRTMA